MRKEAPLARLTFDFDAAAVVGHDPPALGEAQSQAAAGGAAGEVGIEQMAAHFGRNAGTVVGDDDLDSRRCRSQPAGQRDAPVLTNGFDRVVQHGPHGDGQLRGVGR